MYNCGYDSHLEDEKEHEDDNDDEEEDKDVNEDEDGDNEEEEKEEDTGEMLRRLGRDTGGSRTRGTT